MNNSSNGISSNEIASDGGNGGEWEKMKEKWRINRGKMNDGGKG